MNISYKSIFKKIPNTYDIYSVVNIRVLIEK